MSTLSAADVDRDVEVFRREEALLDPMYGKHTSPEGNQSSRNFTFGTKCRNGALRDDDAGRGDNGSKM
jgi:hypothetical protein